MALCGELLPSSILMADERDDADIHKISPDRFAVRYSRGTWHNAPHLQIIGAEIAKIAEHPIRLMVFTPPRHGKSELISHWTSVWYLSRWPANKIILTTYEASFAAHWGGEARDTLDEISDEQNIHIRRDTQSKSEWRIQDYNGGMITAGVGGAITGRGANLFIIDDPVKNAKEALSPVFRETAKQWYRSTAFTRLEPDASQILIMTRWHDDDLAGWILKELGGDWVIINLPAIAEPNDILGRKEGEALWPERYPIEKLIGPLPNQQKPIREIQGPYWWNALYQQRPSAEAGAIVRLEWWKYYKEPPSCGYKIQSWDTAFKKGEENDYSVCTTMGVTKDSYPILDMWRGRPEFPELERMVEAQAEKHKPDLILIEDKASGQSVIQTLRRKSKIPIVARQPKGDKQSRVHAVSGIIEAGKVLLPENAEWLSDWLDEWMRFPTGAHDDIVDSGTQGLLELSKKGLFDTGELYDNARKESTWTTV